MVPVRGMDVDREGMQMNKHQQGVANRGLRRDEPGVARFKKRGRHGNGQKQQGDKGIRRPPGEKQQDGKTHNIDQQVRGDVLLRHRFTPLLTPPAQQCDGAEGGDNDSDGG